MCVEITPSVWASERYALVSRTTLRPPLSFSTSSEVLPFICPLPSSPPLHPHTQLTYEERKARVAEKKAALAAAAGADEMEEDDDE